MANLKIRLFGAPTIELNGQLVDPGRRRVIALAAYLSASDAPQSRAGICAMLWPEKSAAIARAELRRSISTLRSCIGPRFVETTRSTVALSPDASVDIREFRAFLESSIAHPGIEDAQCPDCIRALETAVALYRGDFLDGLSIPDSSAFDDWQIFEAERLRESLNHALERLSRPVSSADERPRESTALEYAHRWVRMDNLNEAAHRRLMILYAIDGQRGAALRQYAACEKILGEELGALPDRKTAELKKKIGAGPLGFELAAVSRDEIGATPRTSTVGRIGSKNRRRRTQTMVVLAFALVAATIGVAYAIRPVVVGDSPGIPIAVIPLVDHSSDTRNKWFVDGMTEAIITNLARIRALRVTSHSSVDALADGHPSISEIRRRA
jgi:DNA-binding SARP family transcriptional activator